MKTILIIFFAVLCGKNQFQRENVVAVLTAMEARGLAHGIPGQPQVMFSRYPIPARLRARGPTRRRSTAQLYPRSEPWRPVLPDIIM